MHGLCESTEQLRHVPLRDPLRDPLGDPLGVPAGVPAGLSTLDAPVLMSRCAVCLYRSTKSHLSTPREKPLRTEILGRITAVGVRQTAIRQILFLSPIHWFTQFNRGCVAAIWCHLGVELVEPVVELLVPGVVELGGAGGPGTITRCPHMV